MMKFRNRYVRKILKKELLLKKSIDYRWVVLIIISAFLISMVFSLFSETIIANVNSIFGTVVIILFIILGIVSDMIGISVTVGDFKTFNSMATKKIKGAKTAIKLMKNASKVSSFFNDVIGDICGIISGSAGVTIALNLAQKYDFNIFYSTLIITSLIAALTIGGKAIGKNLAMNKSHVILYRFARIISPFIK